MSDEAGFAGALVGLAVGAAYLNQKTGKIYQDVELALVVAEQLANAKKIDSPPVNLAQVELATYSAWAAPIGLLYSNGNLDKKDFVEIAHKISQLHPSIPKIAVNDAAEFAAGIAALVQHEILPEDLMSAVLDFFPPDPDNMAVRAGLLVAQDCLEERQTLVDNIEAGDLFDVDLLQVDFRNMERASRVREVTLAEKSRRVQLPPAFYAFAACKQSFAQVMPLVSAFADAPQMLDAAAGVIILATALAGAYHGLDAIPEKYLALLPDCARIIATAKRLAQTASN